MIPYFLALLIAVQSAGQPAQDEIKDGLARAETLYYEAKFNESIKILTGLNELLKARPDRLQDRITAKLQLALSSIGINDTATAKTLLGEVYEMDSDYVLDSRQFSPKVIALANDAKNEQRQIRCQKARDEARANLNRRDSAAITELFRSMKSKCPELAQLEPEAADIFYKQGLGDYKNGNLPAALQAFRTTLRMVPSHDLAAQYLDLTESKLKVDEERLLMQWQKNFDAGKYKDAAVDYRTIRSFGEVGNATALSHATGEYRKALLTLVDNWTQACAIGDDSVIADVQNQITELLPDPSFAGDLRSKMAPCTPEPRAVEAPKVAARIEPKPEPTAVSAVNRVVETKAVAAPSVSCFQMDPQAAMTRLKTRVDPQLTREALTFIRNSQVTVRVKVHIDETGSVTVLETIGGNRVLNNSVRTAVEQWKFSPARDEKGPRCVDTELPVAVKG